MATVIRMIFLWDCLIRLFMILNCVDAKIICFIYLYIACGNLIVTVNQRHNLTRITQNTTDILRITLIFWSAYVNLVIVGSNIFYIF